MRILIVGGSIGGLTASALLRRAGHEVTVFERSAAPLSGRGAGIVTHPETHAILEEVGIPVDPDRLGVSVEHRRVLDRDGHILCEGRIPQLLAGWGRIHRRLAEAAGPVLTGHELVGLDAVPNGVFARFAGGAAVSGDLLVAADGLFSTVKTLLLPRIRPTYAGYVAWRLLVDGSRLSPATRAAIGHHFAFQLPPGEQILGYPVSAAGVAGRRYNVVWYRPAPEAELARLLTDRDGVAHALSIPPNRIRPDLIDELKRDAEQLLAPPFAEVVNRAEQPFLQAIVDAETPTMVPAPRVALVGDAAFVARPHLGMGVTKAMADASALSRAIVSGPTLAASLADYDRERQPYGAAIVARARSLGACIHVPVPGPAEREEIERHRQPAVVMAETAVPPLDLSVVGFPAPQ